MNLPNSVISFFSKMISRLINEQSLCFLIDIKVNNLFAPYMLICFLPSFLIFLLYLF